MGTQRSRRRGARWARAMGSARLASTTLGAAALLSMAMSPALALEVTRQVESEASPGEIWRAIGGFCQIADWHPAVTACEERDAEGVRQRTLTLDGGGVLVEDLLAHDDDAMSYSYAIIEGPLPVADYEATISVAPAGEGSAITWTGTFDAAGASDEEARRVIGGIYDAGLAELAEMPATP